MLKTIYENRLIAFESISIEADNEYFYYCENSVCVCNAKTISRLLC